MQNLYLILTLSLLIFSSCMKKENADLVVKNTTIYSVDDDFGIYSSMAIKDGEIIELSKDQDLSQKYTASQSLDLKGKYIYPGLIDPHCHFWGYGTNLQWLNLVGTTSFDEIVELLKEFSKDKHTGWLAGRGWDQNDWNTKVFPDNKVINKLFPNQPVVLIRIDGHAVLANDAALKATGIDTMEYIDGGKIIRRNGKATGICLDKAADIIKAAIPAPSDEANIKALLKAQKNCFRVGLTSVHDAGLETDQIRLIEDLQSKGLLKMRIFAMLSPSEENLKTILTKGKIKTPFLNVSSLKLYADGALGSRGALLLEPYCDSPDTYGIAVNSEEFIREHARLAFEHDFQVCTHCIGDSANRMVLRIYKDILKTDTLRRWRIEHAQFIHPDDIHFFGDYGIIPSIQSTHATSDMYWAEKRLGSRVKNAYIYKQLLQENNWIPNGSDFPVEDINPLYGFYAAVTRKDKKGYPTGGFQMENALSREDALRAMTIWAAMAGFEENEKGSLEPGKFADFVVFDKDFFSAEEDKILQSNVQATFINGEKVFSEN